LTINRLTTHYTSFCKSFVVCVSEKEINCAKSPVLKVFQGISTFPDFSKLNLPLVRFSTVGLGPKDPKTTKVFSNPGTIAFEIDLN